MSLSTLVTGKTASVSDLDRYQFDLNGYVVIPGALEAEMLARLNELVEERCAAMELEKPGQLSCSFAPLLPLAEEFRALIDHAAVLPYLNEWLGPNCRLDHEYAVVFRPQCGAGGASHIHGGAVPYNASRTYSFDHGGIHSCETAVSYALTDVRTGDGGMGVIPGSHKANLPLPWAADPGPYAEDVVRPVLVSAGSAVIFTESLSHCSLPWRGLGSRRTLFYKYTPRHIAVSVPKYDRLALPGLSERQRALLEPAHK